jgi:protein TonB
MKLWVLTISAVLHIAALAALLPWPAGKNGSQAEVPPIEVELVQQRDSKQGATPVPSATGTPVLAPDPLPPDAEAAPRSAGSPRKAAVSASAANVNLGDADETRDGIDVTGQGVVRPSLDSKFRNQPPNYPIEAARMGAEGTVSLMVHVSAQGLPQDVAVASSSGNATLDATARNAVRRWHFTPARIQGAPVPFDYALDIRFILGDRQ